MKKESLRDRILSWLRKNPEWHNGGQIEQLAMSVGYKGSTASRECRHLVEESKLLREERKGRRVRSVWYKIR